jgi:hypothetical protein
MSDMNTANRRLYLTYNGNDTGHNDGNGTLHHEIGSENGHGRDSNTRLCGSVSEREAVSAVSPSEASHRRDRARPFSPPLRAHGIDIATHAAPIQVKMMALAQPIAPKKGA